MSSDATLFEPFAKQEEYQHAALSEAFSYLLYGGAIRGGKSYVAISQIIALCKIYPGSRWAITRKDLPTLKRNTIPVFEKLRPVNFIQGINKSDFTARCANNSEILFFPESIKDDPDLDRWKGLEVNGFLLEECNELQEKTFYKAIERAGTWNIPGLATQPDPKVFLTCNPSRNWVKKLFYDPWKSKSLKAPFFYLPANADDNPHVPEKVREGWKNLPEREYERFVKGNWDVADDPDQLIKYEWVVTAQTVEHVPGKNSLGVDVARFGDDKTCIAKRNGNCLKALDNYEQLSIDKTADFVQAEINNLPVDADNVNVDSVGLGAGVVDNLRKAGFNVKEFISGARAQEDKDSVFQFNNLRSQAWWNFREMLRKGEISLEYCSSKLIEDLTAPKYSVSGDKVLKVESKDEIKKRIGRSTDEGDAVVYAFAQLAPTPIPQFRKLGGIGKR